jgi:transporter family-2 protein
LASSPLVGLFGLGIVAGAMITVQSVLNASLGGRAGLLGSVLLLTLVSIALLIALILVFPSTANFRSLPGPSEWYLYLGGALGILILAAPIFLVPRLGAALTLTAIVLGQLVLAVVIDHFGLLAAPKIEASLLRVGGVALIALGAFLVSR